MIAEKIENENETVLKYEDGTMMIFGKYESSVTRSDYWSFCDRSDEKSVKFSIPFKQVNHLVIAASSFQTINVNYSSLNNNSFNFHGFYAKGNSYNNVSINYIAEGTWK